MKHTKHKLLSSIATLFVCLAMFIGSTYAWFTDSASTGVNKIQAGNLDIEVSYKKDGTNWTSIQDEKTLFSTNLWEPGHTEFVTLKVENKGTLALKYKMMVTPVSENGGINVYDDNFKLSDYLVFGTVKNDTEPTYTRESARDAVGTGQGLTDVNNLTEEYTMAKGAVAQYITLVVYMPEGVDNHANAKPGTTAPSIDLGIKVVATQLENESDSFGPDYDAKADEDSFYTVGSYYDYFPQVVVSSGEITVDEGTNTLTNEIVLTKTGTIDNTGTEVQLVKVTVPEGTKLAEGTSQLTAIVKPQEPQQTTTSTEGLRLEIENPNREIANFDVKVEGVASDNDKEITVEALVGKGLANIALYHNGNSISYESYDPLTGIVTFKTATFSDYTVAFDAAVAAIGTKTYGSLQLAINAAEKNATVVLLKDISLTEALITSNYVTINMNGKNITGNGVRAIHVKGGKLILDGTGTVSSTGIDIDSSVIRVGDNNSSSYWTYLYVNKGVTVSTDCSYGITSFGSKTEYVHVYGTVVSTAPENKDYDGCAISTLGTDTSSGNVYIYDGANVSATNTNAIYMPSGSLYVYDGATVTGRTGIYVKSGTTKISGGIITGTGAKTDYNYYGNGGISTGEALVVDSCGYPKGTPSVTVEGGKFISNNANAVGSYNTEGNPIVKSFITGGTFSSDPDDLVRYDYTAVNENGAWNITSVENSKDQPYQINNESDWCALAANSSYGKTTGKYYVVDKDLNLTGYKKAGLSYFEGNIDFKGHSITGLTGSNTYKYRYPSIFSYVRAGATIKNLNFELPNLGTDNTVKPIGAIEGNGDVTLENISISGNLNMTDNNTGLLVDFVGGNNKFVGTLNLIGCTSTCNMVNNGYSSVFIGGIYKGGNKLTLTAKDCVNYGKIISTGNSASMLISNPTRYNGDELTLNIENCRNEGRIIAASGKTSFLVMADPGSERKFLTTEEIKEFETNGSIVNANGGIVANLRAGELTVTDDAKFNLVDAADKANGATRFELSFGFQGTGGLGAGGVTNYAFTFDSPDAVENVSAARWVNASNASGEITAHNKYGTTYYTDGDDNYVYNQPGYTMSGQPEVSFIAYDAEGNVMLVDFYSYSN